MMNTFGLLPDYGRAMERYEAFWNHTVLDRPPVSVVLWRGADTKKREYATLRDRWLDVRARAEDTDASMRACTFLYDALPVAWPNLGPEIFSAWCGCGYEFGEDTAWSSPLIGDWTQDLNKARLNVDCELFKKTVEFTRLLLEYSHGDYIVGMTDLHTGGDHLAALRDPANLAIDLLDDPDYVKEALSRAMPDFYAVYGYFYAWLRENGMPISTWTPLAVGGKFGVPSNDFSCMISKDMFDEFFLPGLRQECAFYDRSIYHLDGPNALRHLDSILSIRDLDAVQWVPGAGNEIFARWIPVYQKIQKAGKSIQLSCRLDELDEVVRALSPEGVWFSAIYGVGDEDTAKEAVKKITKWR